MSTPSPTQSHPRASWPGRTPPDRRSAACRPFPAWPALALLLAILAHAPGLRAETLRAWLEPDRIGEADSTTLVIESDAGDRQINPDLGPLEQDFDVLGTSTSSQIRIVNGRTSAKTQLRIQLEPKRSGEIRIPELKVGAQRTDPVTLTVVPLSADAKQHLSQSLYIRMEAKPENPYVQSQVRLTVKLYSREPILEGTLDDPTAQDAVLERIGEDRSYQSMIQGHRYQVVERRYALFPQHSGTLQIPSLRFQGRVQDRRRRSGGRSLFGPDPFEMLNDPFFGGGLLGGGSRRVAVRGNALELEVRPRPTGYSGRHWLPAEDLQLTEHWSEGKARVGEPLTRTLSIEAKGLAASLLPPLDLAEPPDTRVYPDQPKTENQQNGSGITGHLEQRIAIIPTRSGSLTLPEVRIAWWNTDAEEQREAVLPARTVTVLPGNAASPASPPPSSIARPAAKPSTSDDRASTPGSDVPSIPPAPVDMPVVPEVIDWQAQARDPWLWTSAALLILWLTTLGWRRRDRRRAAPQAPDPTSAAGARAARLKLRKACARNDPRSAAKALLEWAECEWPNHPPANLGILASRLEGGAGPMRELDRALYAEAAAAWQGQALWNAVKDGLGTTEKTRPRATRDLPGLYPGEAAGAP